MFSLANTDCHYRRRTAQIYAPPPDVPHVAADPMVSLAEHMPAPTRTLLGKRPRDNNYVTGYEPLNAKRRMTTIGVLEAAGSTSRAHHRPATRTLVRNDNKSLVTGRGAERLTATHAQEVSHQLLPEPSVQGELVRTTARGQSHGIEGREELT
jgi:hypothetical protein